MDNASGGAAAAEAAADYDWVVIGSGFGGSVCALRLAEKGYRVALLEAGERFTDATLPRSSWDLRKYVWSPRLGLRGILRQTIFKDVAVVSGAGVGGGSLVYAATLYRPNLRFYANPQWAGLGIDWEAELAPHFEEAERMLGVVLYDQDDAAASVLREVGARMGVADSFVRAPVGLFLGEAGRTVADPYFGGEGPARTGCIRCSECHLGCRVGAKNTLEKNYLWFAERLGVKIMPRTLAVDVRPADAPDGSQGYVVATQTPGAWLRKSPRSITARGVVLAGGALGTNELLARASARGSLPRLSSRLGDLVRTNSEALYAVTAPHGTDWTERSVITASIHPDADTHVEFDNFGAGGDLMSLLFSALVGPGGRITRPLKLAGQILRHPRRFARTRDPRGWSRRTLIVLVMQNLDNAISLKLKRLPGGAALMQTAQDPERPIPTHIPAGDRAALLTAELTGGVAQSSVSEALLGRPATAHILGGAVVGADAATGVVDIHHRVFGYENLLVCDGAAVPGNPGVNPSLTITAMAERAMSFVPPSAARRPAPATRARQPA